MRPVLTRFWAKRKAIVLYGLLLLGGWFLGDALKEMTVPEMRPLNEPMIHRIVMTAFFAFIVLAALPFVPGAEIGFALLLLFGGPIAPLVYLGMVGALLVSYTLARLVPLSFMGRALEWLGLRKASRFVVDLDSVAPDKRLNALPSIVPSKVGQKLLKHRYVLLAVALNTPGNSLLGGGGGLAFVAGASRLFGFWQFLGVVLCAVAPIPLFFLFA
ncbi:hypothetical protein [Roseovarius sp. ZX-A-9]|uniref:hypothetical protein n=1 Tax=Roseovarius sp. ZX-A-9 TaxID=3014783 RepID=UPI00232E3BBB|nr:hypothetical protein [Roseovarius sp. ZX-A-9]